MSTTARRGFATATPEIAETEDHRTTNVCGMIALFCALVLLALPAIVFGVIGLAETMRRDYEDGVLLAAFGLLIGVLEVAALIVWLVLTDWTIGVST